MNGLQDLFVGKVTQGVKQLYYKGSPLVVLLISIEH